jgi:hypothetical protein
LCSSSGTYTAEEAEFPEPRWLAAVPVPLDKGSKGSYSGKFPALIENEEKDPQNNPDQLA